MFLGSHTVNDKKVKTDMITVTTWQFIACEKAQRGFTDLLS